MQIKTFSKLVGALAYLFGKVKASEDSGHVVIVAFWLGRYFVLAETHLTQYALDAAYASCPHRATVNYPSLGSVVECEYSPRQ